MPTLRTGSIFARRRLCAALGLLASTGCTRVQQGRVYSMADGRSTVIVAERPFGSSGTLSTSLPNGEPCRGRFSEVAFSDATGLGACNVPLTSNAEAGIAVLTCNPGHVLHCTLARRSDDGFSYGACTDQQGAQYSMMF